LADAVARRRKILLRWWFSAEVLCGLMPSPRPSPTGRGRKYVKRQLALPFCVYLSHVRQHKHPVRMDLQIIGLSHVRL
jgi:hypothetical protein